jgi:hypothetical protein
MLAADLREILEARVGDQRVGVLLAKELVRIALQGDGDNVRLAAIAEIHDRLDGKPKQRLVHDGQLQHDLRVRLGDRPPDFGEGVAERRTIEAAAVVSNGAASNGTPKPNGIF